MEFNENKPIYIQIADDICEQVLSGKLAPGGRIASVREWGATIGVNPNTVARSYDELTDRGVIFQKRGIGFFVADQAREAILSTEKRKFITEELPEFVKRANLLGINLKELI
ncbi:MAG: GntR family transcriptional regulator [Bacteroidales bacterium]|nr:GntR family transcriptional regulator [Bacteroidales bacterium]MBP5488897.1 GntR family transcriptional regulator [Bacteroidales bacterium]